MSEIARAVLPVPEAASPRGFHQFTCACTPDGIIAIEDRGEGVPIESPPCPICSKPMLLSGYRAAVPEGPTTQRSGE